MTSFTSGLSKQQVIARFVSDLKKRNEKQHLAVKELHNYISTELREVSNEELNSFLDLFKEQILELVKSSDSTSKVGGILAIIALINADMCNTNDRISRFNNYLRNNCIPPHTNDVTVIELASKAIARLTQVSGSFTANLKFELIEHEVRNAFELLEGERSEGKQYAAVLILREIAFSMPTSFFQNVSNFFDVIFYPIWDPRARLREAAVNALRAGLVVTAQRESNRQNRHPHQSWYNHCLDETIRNLDLPEPNTERRSSLVHGSLLVLIELFRCSNKDWELTNLEIENTILNEKYAGGGRHGGNWAVNSPFNPEKLSGAVKKYYISGIRGRSSSLTVSAPPTEDTFGNSSQIPFSWFGTVMVGKEPIVKSTLCSELLNEQYENICRRVFDITKSNQLMRYPIIQNTLLVLLPRLAAFNKELFTNKYLSETIQLTDKLLQERYEYAFVAFGLLAVAVEIRNPAQLKSTLGYIKLNLPSKDNPTKKRMTKMDPAIFACISLLARAAEGNIETEVEEMLEPMLSAGLSHSLTIALQQLAIYLPMFRKSIADGLLKILSVILMHQPLLHPGTPKRLLQIASLSSGVPEQPDIATVVLGLQTLGTFDFDGHSLLHFVRHCADTYLHSEEKMIRKEAVITCSSLLRGAFQNAIDKHPPTIESTINDVLAKLLIVGITDQDSEIRSRVMDSLDECFDYHLAQAENLSALFVGLRDEVFEIREQTICIIGRLCYLNPAYIMPSLRMTLMQLLTEMDCSGIGRNKEQSARMLGHLVSHAPCLIKPYVKPILAILTPKLKETDPNPMVITSVLRAIGDLAHVGGTMMSTYLDEFFPLLLEMMTDASSSQKREISLWTLGELVESAGYTITPYQKYPSLLDTLLSFLKTEQQGSIRGHTLRLLGLLGALDPYKHKVIIGQIDSSSVAFATLIPISDTNNEMEQSWQMSPSELLVNSASGTLEEFYPSVAIATLMKIIRDPTLSQHHNQVVQAVTHIFRALGIKSVPYIPQVIPSMINVIHSSDSKFHDNLFNKLGLLIGISRQHIRNYLPNIFNLIKDFWSVDSPLQPTIIDLVENISVALGSEFKTYLPTLIPQILKVLSYDTSSERSVTAKLLNALKVFGGSLSDFIHLILPKIVALFNAQEIPMTVRRSAFECIDCLAESVDFGDYASLIIHPLVRCLDRTTELRTPAMDTLSAVIKQLGKKYVIFVPLVRKVLIKHKICHQDYDIICARIVEGSINDQDLPALSYQRKKRMRNSNVDPSITLASSDPSTSSLRKMPTIINIANLQEAWAVSRRVSREDWLDWYSRLCSELLKASPSPALRACWTVAQHYTQLAKDLFNASFVSCWTELDAMQQDELMNSLEQALTVPDLPEISQTVLNLAEFMEHCDKGPLPLNLDLLGEQAIRCRAYAKALHYKEDEFHKQASVPVLEALISINNKLGQKEAAAGLLEWAQKHLPEESTVQERWYEKLHDWENALVVYKEKAHQPGFVEDSESILGRMRCLEALGEWAELYDFSKDKWEAVNAQIKDRMCRMAAAAAWGVQNWEDMEKYISRLPKDSQDYAFYHAVLYVHQEKWSEAQDCIIDTRDRLDTEFTALSLESYQRAYPTMVSIQAVAELEEVMVYKLRPERQSTIREMWWSRLKGCQRAVEDWQRILHVRSLVVSPQNEVRTWLKYSSLCRKSGRLQAANRTLIDIMGFDPSQNLEQTLPTSQPHATFGYCKYLWSADKKDIACNQLSLFVRRYLQPRVLHLFARASEDDSVRVELQDMRQLLAKCSLRLGKWIEIQEGINQSSVSTILQYYSTALENNNIWYKAWHSWSVMNFEAVLVHRQEGAPANQLQQDISGSNSHAKKVPLRLINLFVIPALKGFVRSIALSKGNSLQDTLRLLTLLFDYGYQAEIYDALHDGIRSIEIDSWLLVIPQLIARIDTQRSLVSRLIHGVLMDLGKCHPQALVYSLTVATKSSNPSRRLAAIKILSKIREHCQTLVSQAVMVSDELIRVAILWHEQWHEGLEEASRLYFGERNIPGMLAILKPLHAMLEKGPQTLKETSFQQAYGNDLNEAKRWCEMYEKSLSNRDLNQAWDLYYHVFRRISRQLPKLTQLELQYVSPKLMMCQDLELAVPGSYIPNQPIIKISHTLPSLQVITSKQRPRKLSMKGSNGRTYMFLLKGHEDIRQDERVMQFFSLVNLLLQNDPETFRRNLAIQRFAVIPLSTNSGLIGWVPHSDTLHGLIKDYREKKRIVLNIEHRIMQRMTPNFDHLPLMNKVEVFEHSLENTPGDDLAKILLLKAPSSEVWFDRRTNFTRSLAVMSIVGYVLGLGDRHPSNLLLDRMSGKVLHIDFGDCFEVAMTREKFPEKIPFRLTRMLINAMEVTGVEGTYRSTCQTVMTVLRHNKDSLMAVLEAFVYDPLLNWRLIETGPKGKKSKIHDSSTLSTLSVNTDLDSIRAVDIDAATNAAAIANQMMYRRDDTSNVEEQPDVINKKALDIIHRVRDKLNGRDFSPDETLDVKEQVDRLIEQARNNENLCQSYIGWCPFW